MNLQRRFRRLAWIVEGSKLRRAGHGVAKRYKSPKARLSEAKEALEKAIHYLGDVDPLIYSAKELIRT